MKAKAKPATLASRLRAARAAANLTQDQAAAAAGIHQSYLSLLESGARTEPTLSTLRRVAAALGRPLAELIGT